MDELTAEGPLALLYPAELRVRARQDTARRWGLSRAAGDRASQL